MSEKAAPPASTEGGESPQWDTTDRMRKALRHARLRPQEMAGYLGVSRQSVGNWINGRVEPSTQTLRLWALRCGVPYAWLREGKSVTLVSPSMMPRSWTPGHFRTPAHLAAA